jgi:hypothetical protein
MRETMRIQKPVRGEKPRVGKKGYMHVALRRALKQAQDETGASESFIVCVAVAKLLKVKNQEWL